MPVDDTWLALTKLYAIVSMASLGILILGLVYLAAKVRRLVKASKQFPNVIREQAKRTTDLVRGRGASLASRGRKLGDASRASYDRISETLRGARDLVER